MHEVHSQQLDKSYFEWRRRSVKVLVHVYGRTFICGLEDGFTRHSIADRSFDLCKEHTTLSIVKDEPLLFLLRPTPPATFHASSLLQRTQRPVQRASQLLLFNVNVVA